MKLEIQRMPETRKKIKNYRNYLRSPGPYTMHKHHIRRTSTKHDALGIKYNAEASHTMHKHQDDAQAPKMFPAKEYTAQAMDQ